MFLRGDNADARLDWQAGGGEPSPGSALPFADRQCLEAFAGFAKGVYAGLDVSQKAA